MKMSTESRRRGDGGTVAGLGVARGAICRRLALRPIDITLVVPVYEEDESVEQCYAGFRQVLDDMQLSSQWFEGGA